MSDEHQDPGFKVEDKRRFTETGELREGRERDEEFHEEEKKDAGDGSAKSGTSADRDATPTRQDGGGGAESSQSAGEAGGEARPGTVSGGTRPLDFSSFIVGMATQALTFLGAVPERESGEIRRNLTEASAIIDILVMLSEKTRGNLSEDESRLMEEMVYDLQMRFVAESRNAGSAKGESE